MIDVPWTVDTNILVYATEVDSSALKHRIARELLARLGRGAQAILVGQVMSELMNVLLRKRSMSHRQAFEAVELLSRGVQVLGAPPQAYAQAWELVSSHHYQVWDALIIAICAEHGVKTLYSEDAGSLKRPLGVQVINPFAELEVS